MKRGMFIVFLLCICFAFPLVAGGVQEESAVEVGKTDKYGGEVNFAMGAAPPTADTSTTSAASAQHLAVHIHETLVGFTEDYQIAPLLAKSWDLSEDALTYTFYLREGVLFHNGEEMTAEDVQASFNRFMNVSVRASAFDVVESCNVIDEYTVEFKLSSPSRSFLNNMAAIYADMSIQPKSVIEGKGGGDLKVPEEIIGTGPYKLASYDADSLIVLERFDGYQPLEGERNGMVGGKIAYFDKINLHIVPESGARIGGIETGFYDVLETIDSTNYVNFRDGAYPNIEVETVYPGNTPAMLFNHREDFSGDLKFRQAILAGLDMEKIALFETGGDRDFFRLCPFLWPEEGAMYLPDSLPERLYNQKDFEKAKSMLKEAGYNGQELIFATTRDHEDMFSWAMSITEQLKRNLGMNVKLEVYDWPSLNARWEEHGWHFSQSWFGSYNYQPMVLQSYWDSRSVSAIRAGYSNPEVDAAFDAAEAARNLQEEQDAWRNLQRLVYEDVISILLYKRPNMAAYGAELANYTPWYRPRFFSVWKE